MAVVFREQGMPDAIELPQDRGRHRHASPRPRGGDQRGEEELQTRRLRREAAHDLRPSTAFPEGPLQEVRRAQAHVMLPRELQVDEAGLQVVLQTRHRRGVARREAGDEGAASSQAVVVGRGMEDLPDQPRHLRADRLRQLRENVAQLMDLAALPPRVENKRRYCTCQARSTFPPGHGPPTCHRAR